MNFFSEVCTPVSHLLTSSYCAAERSFSAAQTAYLRRLKSCWCL